MINSSNTYNFQTIAKGMKIGAAISVIGAFAGAVGGKLLGSNDLVTNAANIASITSGLTTLAYAFGGTGQYIMNEKEDFKFLTEKQHDTMQGNTAVLLSSAGAFLGLQMYLG